jgi:hypothetical protein
VRSSGRRDENGFGIGRAGFGQSACDPDFGSGALSVTVAAHGQHFSVRVPAEFDQTVRQIAKPLLDPRVQGAVGATAICQSLAGRDPGQQLDAFVDRPNSPDVERPRRHGVDYFLLKHQSRLRWPSSCSSR